MTKIKTILVPFDFTEASQTALDYAVSYTRRKSEMHIKLIYTSPDAEKELLAAKFEKVRKRYGKNLRSPMDWVLSSEELTTAILKANETHKADLIIMGTSGAGDKKSGTTNTSQLVLEADCPVLVIPKTAREFQLKNIALVLGKDEIEDTEVLATLLDVARSFNARVHVLTIENEPGLYGYSQSEERNERLLEYYLESFYADHIFIENPDVVQGISDYAADKEIDMIAILPRNHARMGQPSKGRLTQLLTLNAKTPVLAID